MSRHCFTFEHEANPNVFCNSSYLGWCPATVSPLSMMPTRMFSAPSVIRCSKVYRPVVWGLIGTLIFFTNIKKLPLPIIKQVLAPCSFGLNNFGDLPNENIPVQKAYLFHSTILKETLLFCSGWSIIRSCLRALVRNRKILQRPSHNLRQRYVIVQYAGKLGLTVRYRVPYKTRQHVLD